MDQPIEVSAKTVEEAIELALRQLGARRDEVEVEVLSRGKPGFLGFGAELARVRLIRTSALARDEAERPVSAPTLERPAAARTPEPAAARTPEPAAPRAAEPPVPAASPAEVAAVQQAVDRLLELMHVHAQSSIGPSPSDSPGTPVIQVTGEDAGLLIGRSGETLRALQLLANLLTAQQGTRSSPVIVDVERYRERRNEALQRLARRIADRVASSGRDFTLEPMPAYERRIIHLTLANDTRVATESVGEGEDRKVSVRPRQSDSITQAPRPRGGRSRSALGRHHPPVTPASGAVAQTEGGNAGREAPEPQRMPRGDGATSGTEGPFGGQAGPAVDP